MAETNLIPEPKQPYIPRIRHSSGNFLQGLKEVGGRLASLSLVTEERPKIEAVSGASLYAYILEGIVLVRPSSGIFNTTNHPRYFLLSRGLPSLNPEIAVQANQQNKYFSPELNDESILKALVDAVFIDPKHIQNGILQLPFDKFDLEEFLEYTLVLYGGQGNQNERLARIRRSRNYIVDTLRKTGKKTDFQKVLLPSLDYVAKNAIISGTQIWSGGVDDGFILGGYDGGLHHADGVFGVRD